MKMVRGRNAVPGKSLRPQPAQRQDVYWRQSSSSLAAAPFLPSLSQSRDSAIRRVFFLGEQCGYASPCTTAVVPSDTGTRKLLLLFLQLLGFVLAKLSLSRGCLGGNKFY